MNDNKYENGAYLFEAMQMRRLDQIRLRLYAEKPLSGDERRDLANALDALMHGATRISLTEGGVDGQRRKRQRL